MKLSDEHARYEALRAVRRGIHNRILSKLGRPLLDKAMDEIAVFLMEEISFEAEPSLTVLLDFTIYFVREGGKTMVEREREALGAGGDAGADERVVLEAMCRPVYGVVEVQKVQPGTGVEAVELRSGAELFIHDSALSESAVPGTIIAGTLLLTEGMWSFSGGMIAVPEDAAAALELLPPAAPRGWRLDMLYGGKAPEEVVRAIAQDEAEMEAMLGALERAKPKGGKKGRKGKKGKDKATGADERPGEARAVDENQVEIDAAANVIALALEAGGAEMTGHR